MTVIKKTELELDHRFDPASCRHSLNGFTSVLHCHHYSALYTQLADDCGMLDGRKLLSECAEDSFFEVLSAYFKAKGMECIEDRIAIAEQYYAAVGLGGMKVVCAGLDSGKVELSHSHVDEGWMKKWGKRDKPVNFITQGYVAALFSAVFGRPPRTYRVDETEGIVTGAEKSTFTVVVR